MPRIVFNTVSLGKRTMTESSCQPQFEGYSQHRLSHDNPVCVCVRAPGRGRGGGEEGCVRESVRACVRVCVCVCT